jgi:hypothetical protein
MGTHLKSRHRAEPETTGTLDLVPLSPRFLAQRNQEFHGTGGSSKGNANRGFLPAFMDQTTGVVYLSRFPDGTVAPLHMLDSLPEDLVADRSASGYVTAVKQAVIAGFIHDGLFYTLEQAAKALVSPTLAPSGHS